MKITVIGQHDEKTIKQLERCVEAEAGSVGVLCADGHLGYSMPIGGVVGYERHVSPSGVGYDIACGNMAIKTDALAKDLDVATIMDDIWRSVSFGVGRVNPSPVEHALLDDLTTDEMPEVRQLAQTAAQQLGTVGSGNHYVDLFEDQRDGHVWIGVHFGSRGFGHKLATWALEAAGRKNDAMDAPPVLIEVESDLGQAYLHAMALAGRYAYAGRETVVETVRALIGAQETFRVHNHHNFAWYEPHFGQNLWVHRKGATPAFPGQQGFIGSTMMGESVIVEGVSTPESSANLWSTVHGAGRVMSRTHAAGKTRINARWKCQNYRLCDYSAPKGGYFKIDGGVTPKCPQCGHKLRLDRMKEIIKAGVVDFPAVQGRVKAAGIELRGAGADEAPECYKHLPEVLAAHGETVKVLHRLRPIGVAMAGFDTFDPYKD